MELALEGSALRNEPVARTSRFVDLVQALGERAMRREDALGSGAPRLRRPEPKGRLTGAARKRAAPKSTLGMSRSPISERRPAISPTG